MSEKKNIGHCVSFGALSIFLNNFPAKPHHNKSTCGCNFHEWTWFSLPPFEGFCVWRRNIQGRKEWPDSRCTTPSMKHSCGKANDYERHCRLDEYARMHTKFCQLWYPSLALKKKSKAAWIILPNPSFVFTSKVLGPRVAWPWCCLEVKTSFIALEWAASHSMSKRLASPQCNSPRVIVKRSNPLQSKQPCSSCSMTKPMSTIRRPSTTLRRTRGLAFGVRVFQPGTLLHPRQSPFHCWIHEDVVGYGRTSCETFPSKVDPLWPDHLPDRHSWPTLALIKSRPRTGRSSICIMQPHSEGRFASDRDDLTRPQPGQPSGERAVCGVCRHNCPAPP